MPLYKLTTFFNNNVSGYGWSESYYLNSDLALPALMTNFRLLQQVRRQILTQTSEITWLRISTVGVNPRQSLLSAPVATPQGGGPLAGAIGSAGDYVGVALLLRCQTADFTRRKYIFSRGQPDSVVSSSGTYSPDRIFQQAMASYATAIIAFGLGWQGVQTPTVQPVNSILSQANGTISFTYAANLFDAPSVGQVRQIRNKGITGAANLNGPLTVKILSQLACQTTRRIGINPWTGGGQTSYALKTGFPIGFMQVERVVERKPGRPSYLSRGRQRNRVLG
jgi:hypothetical protein